MGASFLRPMNYFGHAAVASGMADPNPRFVLGSMLPDLARLAPLDAAEVIDPEIRRGIAFHLRTDAIFHDHPTFVGWHFAALGRLRARGLPKGPLRAAAHIGVEMLLDDALARSDESVTAYEAALTYGIESASLLFEGGGREFAGLCALLRERARTQLPTDERLALRLGHTLGRRPRLRATDEELRVIARELGALRSAVEADATTLLDDLRSALRAERPHEHPPIDRTPADRTLADRTLAD